MFCGGEGVWERFVGLRNNKVSSMQS